jgi:hypothetical protein
MTEVEWLAGKDPKTMIRSLGFQTSERKLRLFACACCRRVWDLLPAGDVRRAVEVGERLADGLECGDVPATLLTALNISLNGWVSGWDVYQANRGGYNAACAVRGPLIRRPGNRDYAGCVATTALYASLARSTAGVAIAPVPVGQTKNWRLHEEMAQVGLLLDIIGNPFRSVAFSPNWRTDSVTALAARMYESRDFSALPILADALQEAGCDNENILSHCRSEGVHVRGCWVVDLVLGKE